MPIKSYRPYTSTRRFMTAQAGDVAKKEPEKSLVRPLHRDRGRDAQGHISMRHRGGGAKRAYRVIDFKRIKDEVPATVKAIEYDPNRSAYIALVQYADGDKRYILAPLGLKPGDVVTSGPNADVKVGNCLPLSAIPLGTTIHNLELQPGKGAQLCRSAGAGAQLMAKEGKFATVRLPSGETRLIFAGCRATVGQVSNTDHENITVGKAGRSRHLGIRPHVRGVAMNPRDHPHGGGEGRSPVGRKSPVSPWGQPTLGHKTRKRKPSDNLIVKRRS